MKEHPLLMKGPLIVATLNDAKTQTRRLPTSATARVDGKHVSPKAWKALDLDWESAHVDGSKILIQERTRSPWHHLTPKWEVGDHLWLRETWRYDDWTEDGMPWLLYKADGARRFIEGCHIPEEWCDRLSDIWADLSLDFARKGRACDEKWRPSIHIPRWASRIDLDVRSMRAERVQEISEEDALAEGICSWCDRSGILYEETETDPREMCGGHGGYGCEDPCDIFRGLWDSINAKRGFGWDTNRPVWVAGFKRINP